jgi:hypothetical protein
MGNYGFVGLDISKGYADIYAVRADKQPIEPAFRLYDVTEGHERLGKLINKWLADEKFETLYCGVETGCHLMQEPTRQIKKRQKKKIRQKL